jgi:hypothetical protein
MEKGLNGAKYFANLELKKMFDFYARPSFTFQKTHIYSKTCLTREVTYSHIRQVVTKAGLTVLLTHSGKSRQLIWFCLKLI